MSSFTSLSNSGLMHSASGFLSNTGFSASNSFEIPASFNASSGADYYNSGSFEAPLINNAGSPRRSILRSRSVDHANLPPAAFASHRSHQAAAVTAANARALGSTFNINQVPLNQDPNPIVVRRKPAQPVRYQQNVSVKFLKPPPPAPAGDIVIRQERDVQAPPVAPHHITQKPPAPIKPPPQVIRERPPAPPPTIAPEFHSIPGRVIPPPPRKVIVEKLPQLPSPPQDIIIERWLEYPERLRRVVYQPAPPLIPQPAPKNVHIVWDAPAVSIRREFRNLGVVVANPAQYSAQYGASLVHASRIPPLAPQVRPASGEPLAAESVPRAPRLVGDLQALNLIGKHRQFPAYETPYTPFGSHYAPGALAASGAVSAAAAAASFPAAHAANNLNFSSFGSGFASAPAAPSAAAAFNSGALASGSAVAAGYPAFNSGYLSNASFGSGAVAGSAFTSGSAFGSAGALLDQGFVAGGSVAGAVPSFAGIHHGLGQAFGSGLLLANGNGYF